MAKSRPSEADIKRLFAESHNRCAFPKCLNSIILEGSIVGDICHIKAKHKDGSRYDTDQTNNERHDHENLILLCKLHHKIVDDDEISYTVDRLTKMKCIHLERVREFPDTMIADSEVQLLLDNSINSVNQTGGITAHTVDVEALNLFSSDRSEEEVKRKIRAVETVWDAIVCFKKEYSGLIQFHSFHSTAQIHEIIAKGSTDELSEALIQDYISTAAFKELASEKYRNAFDERPFLDDVAFEVFETIYNYYKELSGMMFMSFFYKRYQDWRENEELKVALGNALGFDQVAKLIALEKEGPKKVVECLEKLLQSHVNR